MTNIGKPYEGKPHVRFDEEGLVYPALYSSNGQVSLIKQGHNIPKKIWRECFCLDGLFH